MATATAPKEGRGSFDAATARPASRAMAVVRVGFGLVWLMDASLKWSPAFVDNFTGYLSNAKAGQTGWIRGWLDGWISVLGAAPHVFAYLLAVAETTIALCLLAGLFTNAVCAAGATLSLLIWATAEGFGGPYVAGSTDVGASIVYVLVFLAVAFGRGGAVFGLDARLRPRLGRLRLLCSNPDPNPSLLGAAAHG